MTSPYYRGPAGKKGSPEAAQALLWPLRGLRAPTSAPDPERAVDTLYL